MTQHDFEGTGEEFENAKVYAHNLREGLLPITPNFPNLQMLQLSTNSGRFSNNLETLFAFLYHCPRLMHVSFEHFFNPDYETFASIFGGDLPTAQPSAKLRFLTLQLVTRYRDRNNIHAPVIEKGLSQLQSVLGNSVETVEEADIRLERGYRDWIDDEDDESVKPPMCDFGFKKLKRLRLTCDSFPQRSLPYICGDFSTVKTLHIDYTYSAKRYSNIQVSQHIEPL